MHADDVVERDWSWAFSSLWTDGTSRNKCNLRVVDTVLFNTSKAQQGFPKHWLFTSKSGTVARKKDENVTFTKIKDRFFRFSLANPHNTEKKVCVHRTVDGQQHIMDTDSFSKTLVVAQRGLQHTVALQCYLRPKGGKQILYRNEYIVEGGKVRTQTKRAGPGSKLSESFVSDSKITSELDVNTATIVQFMEQSRHVRVAKVVADYILDDNDEFWLSDIPWLFTSTTQDQENQLMAKKSSKGKKKLLREKAAPLTSSQSLPHVRLRTPPDALLSHHESAPSTRPDSGAGVSSAECKGDFCTSVLGSLRGLKEAAEGDAGNDSAPSWKQELRKSRSKHWGADAHTGFDRVDDAAEEAAVLPDTGKRFTIGNKELLLARGEMSFIQGEVKIGASSSTTGGASETAAALARKWKEVDDSLREDFGRSNPVHFYKQCSVCANCYRVYGKIQRLRKSNFAFAPANSAASAASASSDAAAAAGLEDKPEARERDGHGGEERGSGSSRVRHLRPGSEDLQRRKQVRDGSQDRQERDALRRVESAGAGDGVVGARGHSKKKRKEHGAEEGTGELPLTDDALDLLDAGAHESRKERRNKDKAKKSKGQGKAAEHDDFEAEVEARVRAAQGDEDEDEDEDGEGDGGGSAVESEYMRKHATAQQTQTQKQKKIQTLRESGGGGGGKQQSKQSKQSKQRSSKQAHAHAHDVSGEASSAGTSSELHEVRTQLAAATKANAKLHAELYAAKDKLVDEQTKGATRHKEVKDLSKKLVDARRQFALAMREKEDAARREVLEVEEKYHRELASKTSLASQRHVSGTSIEDRQVAEMVATVERLNDQLNSAQRDWERARAGLVEGHKKELARLDTRREEEAASRREVVRELEDKLETVQAQVSAVRREAGVAKRMQEAAQRQVSEMEAERRKLQQENSLLQQSLKSAGSMRADGGNGTMGMGEGAAEGAASGSGSGVGAAAEGRMAALQATSEARERQLNNKVEYLKAQLGSETRCKEELERSLQDMVRKVGESTEEKRRALLDAEEAKAAEVRRVETRMRAELEVPRAEARALQEKVRGLQSQVSDLVEDVTMARKKQEAAELEVTRTREEAEFLAKEVVKLQSKVEEAEAVGAAKGKGGGGGLGGMDAIGENAERATMEAMLRRVENERQYLKSQLDTEVRCKVQLQEALDLTNARFAKASAEWKVAREASDVKEREEGTHHSAEVQALRTAKMSLEQEVQQAEAQLAEQRATAHRMRDELREGQAQLEKARSAITRLQSELITAREDMLRDRKLADAARDRQQGSMQTVQATVKKLEAAKGAQIVQLEEELKRRNAKISETVSEMLQLQDQHDAREKSHKKALAADRLGTAMHGCLHRRLLGRFAQWCRAADRAASEAWAKDAVADAEARCKKQAAEEKEQALRRAEDESRVAKTASLDAQARMHESLHRERAAMAQADLDGYRVRARKAERERLEELAVRASTRAERMRSDEEEKWEVELQRVVKECERQQADAVRRAEEQARRAAEEELREESAADAKGREEASKAAINAVAQQAEIEVRKTRESYEAQLAGARADAERALATLEEEAQAREAQKVEDAVGEQDAKHREALLEKAKEHQRAVQAVREDCEGKMAEVQAEHEAALQSAKEQAAAVAKAAAEEETATLAARHAAALEEQATKLKVVKANAIMHTTSKWQKMLAECEEKIGAERAAARLEGVKESDERWKAASDGASAVHRAEVSKLQEQMLAEQRRAEAALSEQRNEALAEANERVRAEQEAKEAMRAAHAAELKDTRAQLEKDAKAKAEAAAEAEARERERVLDDARAQAERALAEVREEGQEELEKMQAALEKEMQGAVRDAAEGARQSAHGQLGAELQERVAAMRREHETELARLAAQKDQERREAIDAERGGAAQRHEQELAALQKEAAEEQEAALEQLQQESEKLIGRVEAAMVGLKQEKDGTEAELVKTKQLRQEAEDLVYDLQQEAVKLQKKMQENEASHGEATKRLEEDAQTVIDKERAELEVERRKIAEAKESEVARMQRQLGEAKALNDEHRRKQEDMHDTLVNHKREVLMEHKIQSEVLQNDITLVLEQQEEIESVKDTLEEEMRGMEAQVVELEEELHTLSKQSSIKDGRVNVAYRTKKKRLDGELDAIMEALEEKRSRLHGVEAKLAELSEQRQEKEDDMKDLERNLVEVMVEQQKKLLKTLTAPVTAK